MASSSAIEKPGFHTLEARELNKLRDTLAKHGQPDAGPAERIASRLRAAWEYAVLCEVPEDILLPNVRVGRPISTGAIVGIVSLVRSIYRNDLHNFGAAVAQEELKQLLAKLDQHLAMIGRS